MQATLDRAIASLDSVERAFERELVNLVQTDVIDLDSEVALLERTVEMESLFEDGLGAAGPYDKEA